MRLSLLSFAGAVGVAVALLAWSTTRRSTADAAVPAVAIADTLASRPDAAVKPAATPARGGPPRPTLPAVEEEPGAGSPAPREEVVRAHLEARFADESRDAAWSGEAATAFADGFQAPELDGSSLAQLDCRATICRLEVVHDSRLRQDRFLAESSLPAPLQIAGASHKLLAPALRTIVFVARDGYDLPSLPAR